MEFHEHISSQFIFHGIQVLSAVSSILYPPINYTVNHHLVMGILFFMLISLSAPLWGLSVMAICFSFLSHIWIQSHTDSSKIFSLFFFFLWTLGYSKLFFQIKNRGKIFHRKPTCRELSFFFLLSLLLRFIWKRFSWKRWKKVWQLLNQKCLGK